MNVNIKENKNNTLIGRAEIVATIHFDGATPSNKTVANEIARGLNADEALTAVKHIYPSFGRQSAEVYAFVYDDKSIFDRFEIKAAKPKTAEAAAEEAAS